MSLFRHIVSRTRLKIMAMCMCTPGEEGLMR
jgi:hypothetical protein